MTTYGAPSRSYVFADEAGCMTFERKKGASTWFIVCSITLQDCQVGNDLVALRRDLAWRNFDLGDYFHATTDKQAVRDEVFDLIASANFQIHSTIYEKAKAQPQVCESRERFYKTAFYYHFKHVGPAVSRPSDEVLFTTASIGTKKERLAFTSAIEDVMNQTVRHADWATDFCEAKSDPCLQIADYCAWALQCKWERGETRPYQIIQPKLASEYEIWKHGSKVYY